MPAPPPHRLAAHRFASVQRVNGLLAMLFSSTMLLPLLIAQWLHEASRAAFLIGFALTFAIGTLLWWPVRHHRADLKIRDGFLVVVLFWVVLSVLGAIPFYVYDGGWPDLVDAIFESTSGLTTTGATVASGLDTMPRSILFYRVLLHWLGGMGVIVLAVALLPMLGIGGMQLFRAEVPGPMKDTKLTPRIAGTARALWLIYVALTLGCALTYWLLGMSFFDALCHAMSTIATGGFSNHDASLGHFNSPLIEAASMVFMVLGATSFTLHFAAWRGRSIRTYVRDSEFRAYLLILLIFGLLTVIPLALFGPYDSLGMAVRLGLFQLISFGTSTCFSTADVTVWPLFVPMLLMLSTFMAGCAGSTAGGVKVARVVLFLKQATREFKRLLHPNATIAIKFGGRTVPDDIVYAVGGFFSVYVGLTIVLTFVMIGSGLDPITAGSAITAAITNAGSALGELSGSMAHLSVFGKWVLIVTMVMGRLEIFTFLIIFTPAFWQR
ncbi:potassium transporter TrkG [Sinimarinibacterium sp. NLF-5-8]|uniref:potassium transporter TrkG n=1 Tax=Sinimarinibacterium sp. NLF-5-8 TaxID=2698684 RepID=UPI00137BE3BB|nr:potassium transporter TrkG [Sinimarinibacterium sp. NLF-5-8]QHS10601.1 potassium transporter [Sinimarinibacterium sp. NLF-5-8]